MKNIELNDIDGVGSVTENRRMCNSIFYTKKMLEDIDNYIRFNVPV
jgi:hypothetical protein